MQVRILFVLIVFIYVTACSSGEEKKQSNENVESDSVLVNLRVQFGEQDNSINYDSIKVISGTTVYGLLEILSKQEKGFSFGTVEYPQMGRMVNVINGKKNGEGRYWGYCIDGKMAKKGIDALELTSFTNIFWNLTNNDPCK